MAPCLRDIFKSLTHEKWPRYERAHQLRAGLWLQHAIGVCGSLAELKKRFYDGRSNSKLVDKWVAGDTLPTRSSAVRLNLRTENKTLWVWDLPLAALLLDKPLRASAIRRLMAPYRSGFDLSVALVFPDDAERITQNRWVIVLHERDTSMLFERGDIYGLLAIVASVRTEEAAGDGDSHVTSCADMYRILPALYRIPWIASQRIVLEECLDVVRSRMLSSSLAFDVDYSVIDRQMVDPDFETITRLRKRDPLTRQMIELEDPILPAMYISGAEVRRRQLERATRSERKRLRRAERSR